jgi:hypothetical protein
MTWNTNMSDAPRGATETKEITHWKSGKPFTKDITIKRPILLSVSGEVIQSYWSDLRNTWCGISDDETPDAWMLWPDAYVAGEGDDQ